MFNLFLLSFLFKEYKRIQNHNKETASKSCSNNTEICQNSYPSNLNRIYQINYLFFNNVFVFLEE